MRIKLTLNVKPAEFAGLRELPEDRFEVRVRELFARETQTNSPAFNIFRGSICRELWRGEIVPPEPFPDRGITAVHITTAAGTPFFAILPQRMNWRRKSQPAITRALRHLLNDYISPSMILRAAAMDLKTAELLYNQTMYGPRLDTWGVYSRETIEIDIVNFSLKGK